MDLSEILGQWWLNQGPDSKEDDVRITRLKNGNWSFGCQGRHNGIGTLECPFESHHHHDEFCKLPSKYELIAAGITPHIFRPRSRA